MMVGPWSIFTHDLVAGHWKMSEVTNSLSSLSRNDGAQPGQPIRDQGWPKLTNQRQVSHLKKESRSLV